MQIGRGALPFFVDHIAPAEAVQPISGCCGLRLIARDQMREAEARRRRGLEAAIAPAGIEI